MEHFPLSKFRAFAAHPHRLKSKQNYSVEGQYVVHVAQPKPKQLTCRFYGRTQPP